MSYARQMLDTYPRTVNVDAALRSSPATWPQSRATRTTWRNRGPLSTPQQ